MGDLATSREDLLREDGHPLTLKAISADAHPDSGHSPLDPGHPPRMLCLSIAPHGDGVHSSRGLFPQ
jgi:hypothetical protein